MKRVVPPGLFQPCNRLLEARENFGGKIPVAGEPEVLSVRPQRLPPPVELASLAHHKLVAIHPFIDGNGRTARLIMNLILMRAGYPPTVILRINRQQYYRVLTEADAGKVDPLVNFVGRAVERSLTLYLEASTPRQSQPADTETWIPLREAAEGTPYSQEYLSLLARLGRIDALKRGKAWYTTRKAIEQYQQSLEK